MRTLVPEAPVSPGTGLTAPGRVRFEQASFIGDDHGLGGVHSTREICWRLALVGRTMADLWRQRGLPDLPFLVPVSVDLRPKGEPGATFGNVLAFHFARFKPSETTDVDRLARALRHQMTDALRDGQIDANAVAMEFLKYRPLRAHAARSSGTATRETFSFNCADLGTRRRSRSSRTAGRQRFPRSIVPGPGSAYSSTVAGSEQPGRILIEGAMQIEEVKRIIGRSREMGWRTVAELRRRGRRQVGRNGPPP
jgi:hypothetical protein